MMSIADRTVSSWRVKRADAFLRAPYRSSDATMMLVQILLSPTATMRAAHLPWGFRTRSETMLVSSRKRMSDRNWFGSLVFHGRKVLFQWLEAGQHTKQ